MFNCKICNKEFGLKVYRNHLRTEHNLDDSKAYLLALGFDNKCSICGNETTILNLNDGFRKCCKSCASKTDDVKNRRKQTNLIKYGSTTPAGNADVIGKHRSERFRHRKSELIKLGYDDSMTELEIMTTRGYDRIYDSGSLKYKYNK